MKQIVIEISTVGDVKIDAQCFVGKECSKATEQIEIVLGGGTKKSKKKPEFFATPGNKTNNKLTF